MKFKQSALKFIILALVSLLLAFSTFQAFADEESPDIYEEPAYEEPTDAPAYEEPTDATAYEEPTDDSIYEEPTDEPTYEEPETAAPTYEETEPETDYVETEPETETVAAVGDEDDWLPTAPSGPEPTAPTVTQGEDGDLTYGFVSWACVIIGVLAVIIVIISNKTSYYTGGGKNRYDEGNKITGQKHLLNDNYYNNRKYNPYSDTTRR